MKPPFDVLDPGLTDAERIISGDDPTPAAAAIRMALRRMIIALPNEAGAAEHLNAALTMANHGLLVWNEPTGWSLFRHPDNQDARGRNAAMALALLVAATGWGRLKRCERPHCAEAFIDRTMGASRRRCDRHSRRRLATAKAMANGRADTCAADF